MTFVRAVILISNFVICTAVMLPTLGGVLIVVEAVIEEAGQ